MVPSSSKLKINPRIIKPNYNKYFNLFDLFLDFLNTVVFSKNFALGPRAMDLHSGSIY